ncbi:MAG: hypothetical protein WAX89_05280 [Alphaproteobacteria bacterium]
MSDRTIVIFDNEYTTWQGAKESNWGAGNGWCRELVQIAAIKLKPGQPWQEAQTLEVMVKPIINPILSDTFIQLTGLTQERVDREGVTLDAAFGWLSLFALGDPTLQFYSNGNDRSQLAETAGFHKVPFPMDWQRFHNFREPLYAQLEACLGHKINRKDYPSGRVYELLGLTLPSAQVHNALHDVYSLAATLQELENRGFPVPLPE